MLDQAGLRAAHWSSAGRNLNNGADMVVQVRALNSLATVDVQAATTVRVSFAGVSCVAAPAGGFEGTCSATRQVPAGDHTVTVEAADGRALTADDVSVEVNAVQF
jgi:hypothetical protein